MIFKRHRKPGTWLQLKVRVKCLSCLLKIIYERDDSVEHYAKKSLKCFFYWEYHAFLLNIKLTAFENAIKLQSITSYFHMILVFFLNVLVIPMLMKPYMFREFGSCDHRTIMNNNRYKLCARMILLFGKKTKRRAKLHLAFIYKHC